MTLPGWRDWGFALRTFGAAMLALYLALWIDLPRPYWAVGTVYITSQGLSGATRAKAACRLGGTLLGAAVAVVLVPSLVDAPVLLCGATALWIGACLYVSLLDRTPASYLPMLAGYTAALIGFPSVGEPGAIFDTAVARAEEIGLGILCASLAASLVLPESAAPVIAGRLDLWLAEARGWALEALSGARAGAEAGGRRLRLAAEAVALDPLGLSLRKEATGAERAAAILPPLRQHMLMVLPIVAAVADRVRALDEAGALPPRVGGLLGDLAAWLAAGDADADAAARLRAWIDAVEPEPGAAVTWNALLLASLAARLRDFVDLRQDIRGLRRNLVAGRAPQRPLAFAYAARTEHLRHRDHGMAVFSAFGAVVALLACYAVWIGTGWPDGAGAPMMAAVACCFFATQDDPAPQIVGFATSAVFGAIGAGVYLFAVLPVVTSFEMLVLALAPGLVLCGLMMTQPRTAPMGMGVMVNGATLLGLQNGYTGEFGAFANAAIATIFGMWLAAVVIRLVRSVGAERSAGRLARINRRTLAEIADGRGGAQGLPRAALMLDRVGLIAPRLAGVPAEDAARTGDLLADVRVAINLVELRRARHGLRGPARAAVERVLAGTARHVRSAEAAPGPVAVIDDAVGAAASSPARTAALLGLTGLRRGLFPEAPAYGVPAALRRMAA